MRRWKDLTPAEQDRWLDRVTYGGWAVMVVMLAAVFALIATGVLGA